MEKQHLDQFKMLLFIFLTIKIKNMSEQAALTNKETVLMAMKAFFVDRDHTAIERYWHESYVQHYIADCTFYHLVNEKLTTFSKLNLWKSLSITYYSLGI